MDVSRRALSEAVLEKVFMIENGGIGLPLKKDHKTPEVFINHINHTMTVKYLYHNKLNLIIEDKIGNVVLKFPVETNGLLQTYDISALVLRENYTVLIFCYSVRFEGVFNT